MRMFPLAIEHIIASFRLFLKTFSAATDACPLRRDSLPITQKRGAFLAQMCYHRTIHATQTKTRSGVRSRELLLPCPRVHAPNARRPRRRVRGQAVRVSRVPHQRGERARARDDAA